MTEMTDGQHVDLAGLLETLNLPAHSHETDLFDVQDDLEGEQETLLDTSGVSGVLTTIGEVSKAVKDETDADYRR